jgi:hypothetical protein
MRLPKLDPFYVFNLSPGSINESGQQSWSKIGSTRLMVWLKVKVPTKCEALVQIPVLPEIINK